MHRVLAFCLQSTTDVSRSGDAHLPTLSLPLVPSWYGVRGPPQVHKVDTLVAYKADDDDDDV